MQVTETKSDALSREFTITVPAAEIEQKFEQRLGKLAETVRLPGFRPGKVPVGLLRKRYGEALRGEIIEETINESSQSVISDRGLRPALPPRVELKAGAESPDLEYTMAVELLPEIEQPEFKSITLERLVATPDETAVTETVERLANMVRGSRSVEVVRPATADDIVVVDVVAPADPKPFGDGKDLTFALTDDGSLPGLVEQLLGVQAGETRSVTVTFPADFGDPECAGTTAVYDFAVKELRERDPLTVDDELAKKLGVESLEQLTKDIRDHHEQELKSLSRMRLKRALLDQLDKLYSFPLPRGLIEREYETISRRLQEEDHSQETAASSSAPSDPSPSPDSVGDGDAEHGKLPQSEYYALAERRVRLGLVLAEIGQRNNLRVTPDEIGKAMVAEARRFPGQEKEVIEFLRGSSEAREALAAPLLEEKVVDFILEMVNVTDRPATAADLLREDSADTTFESGTMSPAGTEQSQITDSNDSEV
jgi:trigger factor